MAHPRVRELNGRSLARPQLQTVRSKRHRSAGFAASFMVVAAAPLCAGVFIMIVHRLQATVRRALFVPPLLRVV